MNRRWSWQRWKGILALLVLLTAAWSEAAGQLPARTALPGAVVQWNLPTPPKASATVNGKDATVVSAEGQPLRIQTPATVFVGLVPVTLSWSAVTGTQIVMQRLDGILTVLGPDAAYNARARTVDLEWVVCGEKDVAELPVRLRTFVADLNTTSAQELGGPVKVELIKSSTYPLDPDRTHPSSLCNCRVAEVALSFTVGASATAPSSATVGSWLLNRVSAPTSGLRALFSGAVILRQVAPHGAYLIGPDHAPLLNSILPLPTDELLKSVPASPVRPHMALVAVLDTGMSDMVASALGQTVKVEPQITYLVGNEVKNGQVGFLDDFDVNSDAPKVIPVPGSSPSLTAGVDQGTGHGTPIASLIDQFAGHSADLLPIKVCDIEGTCREPQIVQGICHALSVARASTPPRRLVVNLSLGSFSPSELLRAFVRQATQDGAAVVAAAGNWIPDPEKRKKMGLKPPTYEKTTLEDWNNFNTAFPYAMVFPAGYGASVPGQKADLAVLGVGSLERLKGTEAWQVADTSVRGKHVQLCAPGRYIGSIQSDGKTAWYSGTSYATPVISGLLVRGWAAPPDSSVAQRFAALTEIPFVMKCGVK